MILKNIKKLKEKHNKVKNLKFDKITCAGYIKDGRLNAYETKLLFSLRSRMFPVINNFRENHSEEYVAQKHMLECEILKSAVPELKNNKTIKYEHIFGKTNEQVNAIKLIGKVAKERERLLFTQIST